MGAFQVKKGLDLPLSGEAPKTLRELPPSQRVALNATDFGSAQFRLRVQEGDRVQVGSPLAESKTDGEILLCSPASGVVGQIVRGDRRKLLSIVVENDGSGLALELGRWDSGKVGAASREQLAAALKVGGLWPLLKQRPFGKIAEATVQPKALFVNGMDTAPLAADPEFLLAGREAEFQLGLQALVKIANCTTHLCLRPDCTQKFLREASGVQVHTFAGPHPAGLPGTHIAMIAPINKGEATWTITAYQVSLIGEMLLQGRHPDRQLIAIAGPAATEPGYCRISRGALIGNLVKASADQRVVAGTAIYGDTKSAEQFLGFADTTLTVLTEETEQHYMMEDKHWAGAGFGVYSTWRLFASKLFAGGRKWALGTNRHGGERAIIQQNVYEKFSPLDIPLTWLVKMIPSEDIERLENLGLLELEPEDVALCTFACPSKVDVVEEVRKALALVEKES